VIAQLGERQTEDLEVLGSIPSPGKYVIALNSNILQVSVPTAIQIGCTFGRVLLRISEIPVQKKQY
jgi:hypothetical protein